MRISDIAAVLVSPRFLLPAVLLGSLLADTAPGGGGPKDPEARPRDARLAPYAAGPDHPWNRLHRALFVRTAADGRRHAHTTDPLLYHGSRFLLEGEPHRRAVAVLDEFLAAPPDRAADPLPRFFLQRDLWAAFDYVAWFPDDWVHHSRHEPAAVALRSRLAKAIGRLALSDRELAALPDNYARAVAAKAYPRDHEPAHPGRPFLPPDLFDPAGPWVRFHVATATPMAEEHFTAVCGRAAHVIFLRLPGGRAATERYLAGLSHENRTQFPPGTAVAMVRRALAVDGAGKPRVTPVTELVQIRVYRRIPPLPGPGQPLQTEPGEQDVYEFVLDRAKLFAGEHGLRAVGPDEPAEPFARHLGDPFERPAPPAAGDDEPAARPEPRQLQSCHGCHAGPGIHSVLSMRRGFRRPERDPFRTFALDVEQGFTVRAKVRRYDWGLLQGKLEAE